MELDPLAQVEHIDFAVLQDVPGLGQLGDIVELGIDGDQAIEEIADHVPGLDTRGEMRIEPGDIRFPRHPQRAARFGLLGGDKSAESQGNQQTDEH